MLVHFLLWQAAKAERRQVHPHIVALLVHLRQVHPLRKQLHPLRKQQPPLRKQQYPLTNKNAKD